MNGSGVWVVRIELYGFSVDVENRGACCGCGREDQKTLSRRLEEGGESENDLYFFLNVKIKFKSKKF